MTLESFLQNTGEAFTNGGPLGFGIAFLGGIIASGVCPCTLPVGLGMAGVVSASETEKRRSGLLIAFLFFTGIVINLTLLGALAGRIGGILTETFGRYWALGMTVLSLIGALVAFRGARLKAEQLSGFRRPGLWGAFIYGFVFSLGTSAAPLLLLLTIAAAQASPLYGLLLAFVFGVGRAMPFLLVGAFAGMVTRFTKIGVWRRGIEIVSGIFLLLVCFYYLRAFIALS